MRRFLIGMLSLMIIATGVAAFLSRYDYRWFSMSINKTRSTLWEICLMDGSLYCTFQYSDNEALKLNLPAMSSSQSTWNTPVNNTLYARPYAPDWSLDENSLHFRLAFHWLALALAVLLALSLRVGRKRRLFERRKAAGLCLHCGYDLRGNVSGICPECSTPLPVPPAEAVPGKSS